MKKIEVSKKITIEFTEKELLAILFCLEKYFSDDISKPIVEEARQQINLAKNLAGLLKGYLFG